MSTGSAAARPAPGLILQPLVENAVLHGVSRRTSGGRIGVTARIAGDRLELAVEDDGPALEPAAGSGGSGGVGLANTRARLRELYGDEQELTMRKLAGGGVRAVVSIPRRRLESGETAVA